MRGWTLVVLGVVSWSCTSEPPPAPKKVEKKPAAQAAAWKEIETPVPRGKKIPCETLFPVAKIGPLLAKTVGLIDESARDSEATAVCRLMTVDKKGKQGDEICMAEVYCWSAYDVAEVKKRCDERREQTTTDDVGLITCVQRVQAGEKERHVITTLDPDTRCKVVVKAAPNQFDLAQTKACAKAVLDTLDRSSLQAQ